MISQLLVKMNSLKDSEDAKTMPTDTKGATDDTKTVFNDTEVANKAAMAGKLNVEHSEIVIKKDDVEHHSFTENAMIVSTKVTAKEMAKAAMREREREDFISNSDIVNNNSLITIYLKLNFDYSAVSAYMV